MGLKKYIQKRNFQKTPEPKGSVKKHKARKLSFVIQRHHARRLHYDFRLEFGGTLKSWAVPKGPSLNPEDKRLAVEVEDHPVAYASFEGDIPKGEYGAGHVIVWDNGVWTPEHDVAAALKKGHLDFELHGHKLRGRWSLIRMGKPGLKNNWLLRKRDDDEAREDYDVTVEEPDSVLTGKKSKTAKKTAVRKSARTSRTARLKPPPEFVRPQLAQLVTRVPDGTEWVHEMKFDGYRTLCRIHGNEVRFLTRNNHDWTAKYRALIPALGKLTLRNALLDGEIVCLNGEGHSDFQKLQNSLSGEEPAKLYYYLFDLLYLDGKDLRELPLLERKKLLAALLKPLKKTPLRYSEHWSTRGAEMYRASCRLKLEGVISKDAQAPYTEGRSGIWQKTKCSLRQEFIIGGYTESPSPDRPFGSLLLGVFDDDGKFRYTGRVGTGFTAATFAELTPLLRKLERDRTGFDVKPPRGRGLHWLKPQLVAEIEFKAWTREKVLRMASFLGLRKDKTNTEVHVEKPAKKPKRARAETEGTETVAGVRITHPERIVYPETGTSKLDIAEYYAHMSPLILPFVRGRPLSLLRCQKTSGENCFFQKHADGRNFSGIGSKPVHYKDKKSTALHVESDRDLVQLAQAGTLEIHAWNGLFTQITKPDQIVFDLDPDTPKLWGRVVDTAFEIRDLLKHLGLQSFVNVTGGKGLHVRAPLLPQYPWDVIKTFSKNLMEILVQQQPAHYTVNMNKAQREGKIFLDYLRNGYGATAVVPYSLRARSEPTVALPISWRELKPSLSPDDFLLADVLKMMKRRKDPWAGYFDLKQKLGVKGSRREKSAAVSAP